MKKIALSTAIMFATAGIAAAQTRDRVFDNFDTGRGVQVVSPSVKPIVSSKPTNVKYVVQKVKKTASVESGMGLKTIANNNVSGMSNGSIVPSMRMGNASSLKGFTTGDIEIDQYIAASCKKYGIDPLLIYSQMHQESAFKLKARSNKGASGLMQLMPPTARRFGVTNIYDPGQNIDAGVKYMRWLLDKFGNDIVLALAGYNAGEGAVMKYGNQVPPYRETQEYVRRITARYRSISNPQYITNFKQVDNAQLAKIEKDEKPKSLKLYEQGVITVRLPDGRMRLVTN